MNTNAPLSDLAGVLAECLAALGLSDDPADAEDVADAVRAAFRLELAESARRSVAEARAAGRLTSSDEAAVVALIALATKIDTADEYFAALALSYADRNLRPPSPDNVSLPTFLKYAESLGLTPAGRVRATPSAARKAADAKAAEAPTPVTQGAGDEHDDDAPRVAKLADMRARAAARRGA